METGAARDARVMLNVMVPMRDGVRLGTTIFLPLEDGEYPAVLVRTAYNRKGFFDSFFPRHGMALIAQDCRGRYESDGEWDPFVSETQDAYDTLDWLVAQPWCNGKMGMFGDSYLAATQFAAAQSGHPSLCALNPRFMSGDCWKRAYFCDGAFSLALTWSWLCYECAGRTSSSAIMPAFDVAKLLRTLPIIELDEASGAGVVPFYRQYAGQVSYDDFWETLSIRNRYHEFTMPVFWLGGWYDNYAAEAVTNYIGVREHAPNEKVRDSHRLLIGPWIHGVNAATTLGELDFGPDALAENDATQRWLDCMLHGRDASEFQQAPMRIFVMGLNQWRDEYEWPLARTRYTDYYLRAGGGLSADAPGDEAPDEYDYDPDDPVPTLGGNHSVGPYNPGLYEHAMPGPFDQRRIEERSDVLLYTSDPLAEDLEVTGPVVFKLYAASSARDTDFFVKLTDVYPDGRSINIVEGVIRARFRESVWGAPKLLEPGRVYEYTIDLQVISNLFKQGHRLRVDVMSSNFPLWDRNLNTGNDPATDTEMQVARQTILHDGAHPSHIVLPVV